jgi:hypothetical protein
MVWNAGPPCDRHSASNDFSYWSLYSGKYVNLFYFIAIIIWRGKGIIWLTESDTLIKRLNNKMERYITQINFQVYFKKMQLLCFTKNPEKSNGKMNFKIT